MLAKVGGPRTPTAVPGDRAEDVGADGGEAAVDQAGMAPIPPRVESELRIQTMARTDPAATRARAMKTDQKAVRAPTGNNNRVDRPSSRALTVRVVVDRDVVAGAADVAVAVAVMPTQMVRTRRVHRIVLKANRSRP